MTGTPASQRFWVSAAVAGVLLATIAAIGPADSWPARTVLILFALSSPILAAVDWRERRLPDLITLPLAMACLLALTSDALVTGQWSRWAVAIACALGATLFFFILFIVSPSQMGFGDVKLMLSAGLVLGWHGPILTILGIALGLIIGLAFGFIQIIRGRANRRSHLALGPHLIAGVLIVGLLVY